MLFHVWAEHFSLGMDEPWRQDFGCIVAASEQEAIDKILARQPGQGGGGFLKRSLHAEPAAGISRLRHWLRRMPR